jgi:ATP-dependent helicase HrpA
VQGLEARVRRGHLLDDDELQRFYDGRLPDDVTSAGASTSGSSGWATPTRSTSPTTRSPPAPGSVPRTTRHVAQGDLVLPLSYRYDPGAPLDGVAVHVPLTALNGSPTTASTGRSPATAPSSSARSCGRCPRTCGAS